MTGPQRQHPNAMECPIYAHYGCGPICAPVDWNNFDASLTLRWERLPVLGRYTKNAQRYPPNVKIGDIVKGLPLPDECCRGVYASHVLEHLTLEEFHRALGNTYRILQKGGIFRLLVPDLEYHAREYVAGLDRRLPEANALFLRATSLGSEKRESGLLGRAWRLFNTSTHFWMWDEISITHALRDHGFQHIRRCSFGDCEDTVFSSVENANRFQNAVAMEARR